ncbi:PHD finger protein 20-like protein [Lachnellula suecica]|uniref:PHD finger protein 20-like protein n=1 Tax=Lachnellula suecica TaxID=602035 RepID=A0A8T9CNV4_9HELO|nr:PHD finger protein 20-like protein [Lachnellula suecica]
MSWDQAYSFGNPNAQPPTPTQTPTSAHFPSPTFQTPRNNNSSFEDRSGWTPQFAEEYSVFNSTPGRLTSSQHSAFVDVGTPRLSTAQKRPLSIAGDIAAEIASHVNHLSPNPNAAHPPVDIASQLPSSPGPYSTTHSRFDDSTKKKVTPRKPRKRLEEAFSGQTATPPATASKGSRKLAPKLQTNTMQNESHESQYGSQQTPTHPPSNLMQFPSTSAEFFYPMSAPATAPVYTNTKPFWDPDTNMGGMDMDFTTDDGGMFNTSLHRVNNSFDWGRNNQMFQDAVNVPSSQLPKKNTSTAKRPRPLAPKVTVPEPQQATSLPPFEFSKSTASEDPFSAAAAALDGAVDPGLLFSRHNSISMSSGFEDVSLPPTRPVTSHVPLEPYSHQLREASRDREELLRSRGTRDSSKGHRYERGTVSSPVRGSARPGLHRSVSDTRGKRTHDRIRPRTGRSSPVKLHQRPPSLNSIPEMPAPRSRTEVKFTIDAKGRARTETVVIPEEPQTIREGPSSRSEEWYSSPDSSSSDDEPILIPSRNTSFTLPQPQKGPKLARFETSNRGLDTRRHSSSAYSQSESSSQPSLHHDSVESEAETVVDDEDGSGDATQELRKVMEGRKKNQTKPRNPQHHRYSSNNPRGSSLYGSYSSSTNISPTTITDPDGATPSSSRSGTTRCVCNNPDSDGFMIQCESCDNWLHAECVGIDRRSLPPVYVCAFCANTPNMRGGRIRDSARGNTNLGSSPLAHKSFKSFR